MTTLLSVFRVFAVWAYLTGDGSDGALPPECPEGWVALAAFDRAYELCGPGDLTASWSVELRWARLAWRESLSLPPLADLRMLPPAAEAERALKFAHVCEAYYLVLTDPWQELSYAQDARRWAVSRRRNLGELRRLLGGAAYYRGAMPPPAPFWQFTERRPGG